ncbi:MULTISPECIES: 3-oxoacyl-ACP reductase family protein [Mycolicibacterium]|jgi:3-oxoacyl-[acyl-carrier protein] reductase|uniref:Short-chain dehydrogenase/reductase SDR n=4 Tax=Mycolicibacterium TaxID=1866885 RepID=A1THF8_MYCVP|nr:MULTISPECIES: 3-oxoacyl-ACP reductase family protein [Mycolicibacterium]ABM16608.1 short-chain dehydrogenase/reductase SDR [Mycolicibacterium vanbaalenii PYR-1]MCV7131104.1 3-oxoacyl-ACP reductase FabG [Mycolicibacterium vanbaalenii PYR-1]MDN4522758.1 3-oxoacyl-ACP reductase family protein [Mycolicibacterium austroafricanum]QRZ06894.1 3-oxoacyl-ACP reductase FabG [Mycolicibacterium austroafricanum]QZT56977.1 3-oxoacyl-ACP reductase FabG [Mycolicibacterium austroafricanum]
MSTAPLAGKRALVTGGSRGIGAEIVRRLAADGAAVAFTYAASAAHAEKVVAEVAASGGEAVAIRADSADPTQVADAVEQTVAELGGLDILVNNSAVAHIAPIDDFPAEEFDRLVAINIGGVYWAVRSAIRYLSEGARIINIGSINADRIPGPGLSVYGMTKGAVSSFTRGLARDLGPRGITVNNVQPGPIDTDANPDDGAFAESLKQVVAQGRYGHTSDVASLVSFLAGPESGYITGAHLNVDGGFTV